YISHVAGANRPVYVISIAASLAGCHPRTLRIYEEEGLLEPVRTQTNIRLYSDDDLQRVRVIRYLTQRRGVNLAGVKMLLQFHDIADLLEELARQIEDASAADEDVDGSMDAEPRRRDGTDRYRKNGE
ncbi:MAG TPA: MerR family transcriptional regulator, partial [Candidatus Limnocylindria bacterium]|nr:MerR family transcriptional regulator [Candidatus Limnocylindria bacterium]